MADQMDENTSLRTPATSHPLDPDAEEYKLLRWIGYLSISVLRVLGPPNPRRRISCHIPKTSKFAYVLTLKGVYGTRRQKWYDEQTEHSRLDRNGGGGHRAMMLWLDTSHKVPRPAPFIPSISTMTTDMPLCDRNRKLRLKEEVLVRASQTDHYFMAP